MDDMTPMDDMTLFEQIVASAAAVIAFVQTAMFVVFMMREDDGKED